MHFKFFTVCSVTLEIHHNSSLSFLSLKVEADTLQAAVAETEEAADCDQCLQEETQRQESESSLQMLGLSGSPVGIFF